MELKFEFARFKLFREELVNQLNAVIKRNTDYFEANRAVLENNNVWDCIVQDDERELEISSDTIFPDYYTSDIPLMQIARQVIPYEYKDIIGGHKYNETILRCVAMTPEMKDLVEKIHDSIDCSKGEYWKEETVAFVMSKETLHLLDDLQSLVTDACNLLFSTPTVA